MRNLIDYELLIYNLPLQSYFFIDVLLTVHRDISVQ